MKIVLVIGLPCSGKTTLLKKYKNNNFLVFDDITTVNELPNNTFKDIAISDINFCFPDILKAAKKTLLNKYGNIDFDYVFFENNPVKCINNYNHRNDGRKVLQLIKYLSKEYKIPKEITPLKIWQSKEEA